VKGVTFGEMKANADAMAPGATTGLWKDTANFFHQGTNQRWRGVLTAAQVAAYERVAAARLEPGLARWLAHGRAGAGNPKSL